MDFDCVVVVSICLFEVVVVSGIGEMVRMMCICGWICCSRVWIVVRLVSMLEMLRFRKLCWLLLNWFVIVLG